MQAMGSEGRKGRSGTFDMLARQRRMLCPRVAKTIDDMFHNSPVQTKTESEQAFLLSFVFLGNVKLFLLSICGAVMFTILLVSATPWRCRCASACARWAY